MTAVRISVLIVAAFSLTRAQRGAGVNLEQRNRYGLEYDSADTMIEPWSKFFIPVSHWADGSAAPLYSGT